jgi:AmmeMemoRadiSam system protein B
MAQRIRRAAVAGSWYPARPEELRREVSTYLDAADSVTAGPIRGVIAPHAGLMYSGPVAAHAYRAVRNQPYEAVVVVGPSHYVAFDGVAAIEVDAFETPLGPAPLAVDLVLQLVRLGSPVVVFPAAHTREHSLEMQLPFLRTVLPDVPIVPLLMGFQTRPTIGALADMLAAILAGRNVLLVASSDLSHFFDSTQARQLDDRVAAFVDAMDPEGLLARFEEYPEPERGRFVACGGGPMISVMLAARSLGARHGAVLRYADSGDVSGDHSQVVGYLAATLTET